MQVIPPSQFEIHACKQYRRAAQYICLENGKSLLDLLRACRGATLHTLEVTVQNFVCSPHEERYFTCKRCKGEVCFCYPKSSVFCWPECQADHIFICKNQGKMQLSPPPLPFFVFIQCLLLVLLFSPQDVSLLRLWKEWGLYAVLVWNQGSLKKVQITQLAKELGTHFFYLSCQLYSCLRTCIMMKFQI